MKLTQLSLFSGIGGLDLAGEKAGFTTIGFCEIDTFAQNVLRKHWPHTPIWNDVRTITGVDVFGKTGIQNPTVVAGGFPCQPHSLAGHRLASADERDLWSELFRVFCETGARWLVAENVGGLLSSEDGRYFGSVLGDLAEAGCHAGWVCYPAHATGADFWGERVAIVATSDGLRRDILDKNVEIQRAEFDFEMYHPGGADKEYLPFYVEWPVTEPVSGFERNDDGLSKGVDRLRCIGNAVDWRQFYPVYAAIATVEKCISVGGCI